MLLMKIVKNYDKTLLKNYLTFEYNLNINNNKCY